MNHVVNVVRTAGPYEVHAEPWRLTRTRGGRMRTGFKIAYGVGVALTAFAWLVAVTEPLMAGIAMGLGGTWLLFVNLLGARMRGVDRYLKIDPHQIHIEHGPPGMPDAELVVDGQRWKTADILDVTVRAGDIPVAYVVLPGMLVQLHGSRHSHEVHQVVSATRAGLGLEPTRLEPAEPQQPMLGGIGVTVCLICVQLAAFLFVAMSLMEKAWTWMGAGAAVLGFLAVDYLVYKLSEWVTRRNARDYFAREFPSAFDGSLPPQQGRAFAIALTLLVVVYAVLQVGVLALDG